MTTRILTMIALVSILSACTQDEAPRPQEKSFGGRLGDSYQGMLNDARQGVAHANQQMSNTEQAVRDRLD